MARTKTEYKAPETMDLQGDGLEEVTVTRYLERAKRDKNDKNVILSGADRPVTFKVRVPKDAAGLKAFQNAVNTKTPGKGNDPILTAIRNHSIELAFSALKEADEEKASTPNVMTLYPSFPAVRTTDENEAMAEQVKAALVSGQLKPEDIAALFGKLAQK